MREPTHQLIIQFPESAFADFDDLVRYEDALLATLGDAHEVDGHDIGSGEVNFFIFTDDPTGAVSAIRDAREWRSSVTPRRSGGGKARRR